MTKMLNEQKWNDLDVDETYKNFVDRTEANKRAMEEQHSTEAFLGRAKQVAGKIFLQRIERNTQRTTAKRMLITNHLENRILEISLDNEEQLGYSLWQKYLDNRWDLLPRSTKFTRNQIQFSMIAGQNRKTKEKSMIPILDAIIEERLHQ